MSHQPCVLRIPRSDDPTTFVLVHVSRSGKAALDLKLVATEGESPYVGAVKQSHLKNLRSKNYQGSDHEFEQILTSVLGQCSPAINAEAGGNTGLEVGASIRGSGEENKEMVITVRKRIDSITQRVASITLTQDDDQTIELFEWTGLMISRADALRQQISSLTDRLKAVEDTIRKLNAQLEELVEAKNEHENRLMTNFVQVLNEKKLKIRNQQRLLASAKVDMGKVSELRAATSGRGHRPTETSRSTKRRAADNMSEASDIDDEFERMDIVQKDQDHDNEDEVPDLEGRETPQPLEEETGTETQDEDEDMVSTSAPETDEKDEKRDQRIDKSGLPNLAPPASPPPRRDLPFARKAAANDRTKSSAPQRNQPAEFAETADETGGETDDDEL
ncbi:hypothetical protein VTN77DRAFT_3284 [Rasamsonia byssochlamydoides]|uniref:uncharacterized protein n=1 Tax=Rasamsonia byssochlamydoides TaxID=89139 RepID=UPI003743631D